MVSYSLVQMGGPSSTASVLQQAGLCKFQTSRFVSERVEDEVRMPRKRVIYGRLCHVVLLCYLIRKCNDELMIVCPNFKSVTSVGFTPLSMHRHIYIH